MKFFTQLAYKTPEEIVFGRARTQLRYGLGLSIGNGKVIPEIKYWPLRKKEHKLKELTMEYKKITADILKRAVNLGMKHLQLETELNYVATLNPKVSGEIISTQKDIIEKYHDEYGINLALRVTVADIRFGLREITFEEAFSIILETFEEVASSGADVLSIESMGGKEVFDYSLIRADVKGILFSLSTLATYDMKNLWKKIVRIAERHGIIAGGDTACGFANSAMTLAGGFRDRMIPHVLSAMVRAISASRSLIAYEEGAKGPGKDCGYENVIIKAITGYPMSMEGKSSAVAHSSLLGNITAAICDLWSNEQIENINLFGGTGPQVLLEILYYDTLLLNTALKYGQEMLIKNLLLLSNEKLDAQSLILSPTNAWRIGKAIVEQYKDYYIRSISAGKEAIKIIEENKEEIKFMDEYERNYLKIIRRELENLPESMNKLVDKCLPYYKRKVETFNPRIYGL